MQTLLIVLAVFSLPLAVGCAALGSPANVYQGMTADQIKAVVSDKSSSIVCTHGVYAGATITVMAINSDKGIPSAMVVTEKCAATVGQRIKDAPPE